MATKSYDKSTTTKKKLSLRSALGLAARIGLLTAPVWGLPLIGFARSATIMFVSNFDSGFSEWNTEDLCCGHSGQIVSSPTRAGKGAMKITLNQNDDRRAEIKLGAVPANSEQWYGFSVFVPRQYKKDRVHEIIAQWHGKPDRNLGESNVRPPLALDIEDDKFGLINHWDANRNLEKSNIPEQEWDLGTIQKGKWTDWVFHVKWSYKSDGLIEVWKDGNLAVRKTGPNSYNDEKGPYFKMGVYKNRWGSGVSERTLYFDEVRIGDPSAGYSSVAPK